MKIFYLRGRLLRVPGKIGQQVFDFSLSRLAVEGIFNLNLRSQRRKGLKKTQAVKGMAIGERRLQ